MRGLRQLPEPGLHPPRQLRDRRLVHRAVGDPQVARRDRDQAGVVAGQQVAAGGLGAHPQPLGDLHQSEAAGVEGEHRQEIGIDPGERPLQHPVAPFQEEPHRLDLPLDRGAPQRLQRDHLAHGRRRADLRARQRPHPGFELPGHVRLRLDPEGEEAEPAAEEGELLGGAVDLHRQQVGMRPGQIPEQRFAGDLRLEDQPRVGVVADDHQRPAPGFGEQRFDDGPALLPVRRVAAGVRGDVQHPDRGLPFRQPGQGVGDRPRVVPAIHIGWSGEHPRPGAQGERLAAVPPERGGDRHRLPLAAEEVRHQGDAVAQARGHQRQAGRHSRGSSTALALPPAPPDLREPLDGRLAQRRLQILRREIAEGRGQIQEMGSFHRKKYSLPPMTKTIPCLVLALALCGAGLRGAPMPEPIAYTLRFPAPQTHYVEVEARVPTDGRPEVELMMAVWTPGSYLVREYARTVEAVAAATESGEPLPVEKTVKNRWRIGTRQAPRIVVKYRVYCREMSVRTNFVDSGFALINGAATFLTLADGPRRPHEVRLELPADWKVSASPLAPLPGGGEHAYGAEDFDTLVDSPVYAGNARTYPFEVAGKPHFLVNEGEGGVWDGPRSAADAEKIVRAQVELWGVAPYPRYVIFNLLTESGGGLEHRNACTLMSSRWKSRTHEGYLDWLGLVSHELFHAWNGKRLRPVELGPFDYEREVYTRGLWVVEGITSYYGDLLVHRAGFSTVKEYLKNLSKSIDTMQTTPGRRVQPLDESSFDAWIKAYRRDENSNNSGISYYTKGEVVAFLLDARIRRATAGKKSLDDAMRLAFQ